MVTQKENTVPILGSFVRFTLAGWGHNISICDLFERGASFGDVGRFRGGFFRCKNSYCYCWLRYCLPYVIYEIHVFPSK